MIAAKNSVAIIVAALIGMLPSIRSNTRENRNVIATIVVPMNRVRLTIIKTPPIN